MKKVKKVLSTLLPAFFVGGLILPLLPSFANLTRPKEVDTAIYYGDEEDEVDYYHPDIRNYADEDDDEDEDVSVQVDKMILHYYNEDKGNADRAFYLWVTGVDGKEYNLVTEGHNPGNVMTLNDDGSMMTITLDFSTPEFSKFAKRSGLYFIIKFKMNSESDLNWGGQSDDMFIRYADYPQSIDDKNTCELWTMPAAGGGIAILDSEAKTKVHGVAQASFVGEDWKTIECKLTSDTKTVNWKLYAYDQTYFKIKPKKRAEAQKWYLVKEGKNSGDFNIVLKYAAHINVVYSLESHDPATDKDPDMASLNKVVSVGFDHLYDTKKFHDCYETPHAEKKLGMIYTPEKTTFRVWSPVSANMNVLIYDKDTSSEYCGSTDEDVKKAYDKYQGYHMQYTTGGIWEVTIEGNLDGKYYNFQVDNSLGTNVIMDPYATSAGANGIRGLIYDINGAKAKPAGWDNVPSIWNEGAYNLTTPQELTIYEVHVQDFTGDPSGSWNGKGQKGTFSAFVEPGTRLKGEVGDQFWKKTGYDHLKALGVRAVQLLPSFDYDNDEVADDYKYNWGYNPLNYNAPEGAYSSNPHDGYARVREFRYLVQQMAAVRPGTDDIPVRTIMDVVYNHVSSATGSAFHKLMPRYYFRYAMEEYNGTKQGELFDGSGCHNEVATERPMMRKFIVDSLVHWAKDYKIKGFRFDLMGLIDFQTMIEAKKALFKVDPTIYIYGEGWTSGGYHGEGSEAYNNYYGVTPHNYGAMSWQVYNECNNFDRTDGSNVKPITDQIYLGAFNDGFRDTLRGKNDNPPNSGWIQHGNFGEGFNWDQFKNIIAGLWGSNYDRVNTDGRHTAIFPEQTINYASCHDNWTVVDQMFQTLLTENYYADDGKIVEAILRASLATHTMIMASNAAAFIQGGEEILRTKTIPDNMIDQITDKSSYGSLYGNYVSHNSYNSPIEINAFKWNNKKSVKMSSVRDGGDRVESEIKNSVLNYCDAFRDLIKLHSKINLKRGKWLATGPGSSDIGDVGLFIDEEHYGTYFPDIGNTDPENTLWWSRHDRDDLTNNVAIRMNNTIIFISVGDSCPDSTSDYIGYGKGGLALDDDKPLFNFGNYSWQDYDNQFNPERFHCVYVARKAGV